MIRAAIISAIVHLTMLCLAQFGVGPTLGFLGGAISLGWYYILLFLLMLLAFLLWLLFGTVALAGMGATTAAALIAAGVVALGVMERSPSQALAKSIASGAVPKPIEVAVVEEPEVRPTLPDSSMKSPAENSAPQAVPNRQPPKSQKMFSPSLGTLESEGINRSGATVRGKEWTVTLPTVLPSAAEETSEDGLTRQQRRAGAIAAKRDDRSPTEVRDKQDPNSKQADSQLRQVASQRELADSRATPSQQAETEAESVVGMVTTQPSRRPVDGTKALASAEQESRERSSSRTAQQDEAESPAVAAQKRTLSKPADGGRSLAPSDAVAALSAQDASQASHKRNPAIGVAASAPSRQKAVDAVFDRLADAMPRLAEMQAHLKTQPSNETLRQEAGLVPVSIQPTDEVSRRDGVMVRLAARAEEGFAHAQFNFAEALLQRKGDNVDRKRAIAMLEHAALGGYVPAQLMLAMVEGSEDVSHPRNIAKAHAWLSAAAAQGNRAAARARDELAREFRSSDAVKSMMASASLKSLMTRVAPPVTAGSGGNRAELNEQLRHAAVLGDSESVHVLLAQNADAEDADRDGRTPLIEAAWRGYPGIVEALVDAGAKLDSRDSSGKDALAWAAINGHATVIARLVAAGSPVNSPDADGFTPLMRAAWNGHAEAVAILVNSGADPTRRNHAGRSALDYGRDQRNTAVIRALGNSRTQ